MLLLAQNVNPLEFGLELRHFIVAAVVVVAIAVLAGVVILLQHFPRRDTATVRPQEAWAIDLASLPVGPPPPGSPVLEMYNLPVRLAAIVLAPVGRAGDLPPRERLNEIVDGIVPGLEQVVATHEPAMLVWPRQFSSRGFAHVFFQKVPLQNDVTEKTVWSCVAGVARCHDEPMMAGLILRAETPNRHGFYIMEQAEQWLDVLRVRPG